MLERILSALLIFLPCPLCAQTARVKPIQPQGHFVGESVAALLSKEPEVQLQVNVCASNPRRTDCRRLLDAVKYGKRATVSTSNWMDFVLDGGKVVKLQTLAQGELAEASAALTKQFGPRTSETAFPMSNAIGQVWEDHLCIWDTKALYIRLREDNNPASQNHHLVLVVESRAEHTREQADGMKQPSTNQN